MNCQHCQAELTSKRAKQCADCATIKDDAHRYGTYAATMEAFEKAAKNGLNGQAMRDFVLGKKAEATAENHIEADKRRKEREAAIRERSVGGRCKACGRRGDHETWCEFGITG